MCWPCSCSRPACCSRCEHCRTRGQRSAGEGAAPLRSPRALTTPLPRAGTARARLQPSFLQLAFGVALAVFIMLEYLRLGNVYPVGDVLQNFLSSFTDYRDVGPFILSHMYLLLGCAMPVWFSECVLRAFVGGTRAG